MKRSLGAASVAGCSTFLFGQIPAAMLPSLNLPLLGQSVVDLHKESHHNYFTVQTQRRSSSDPRPKAIAIFSTTAQTPMHR